MLMKLLLTAEVDNNQGLDSIEEGGFCVCGTHQLLLKYFSDGKIKVLRGHLIYVRYAIVL